jgi:hypothetical protein
MLIEDILKGMKRVGTAAQHAQYDAILHRFNRKAVEGIHDFASSPFASNRRGAR